VWATYRRPVNFGDALGAVASSAASVSGTVLQTYDFEHYSRRHGILFPNSVRLSTNGTATEVWNVTEVTVGDSQ
jgi:hypothetical protein